MAEPAVVNASPLIFLAGVGLTELAQLAGTPVYIPKAILDDLAARRCANLLGIPVRGTLGLILTAKRRGTIPQARAVLEQLRAAGMYLSDTVLNRALKTVGE